jgi:hypothetical protein
VLVQVVIVPFPMLGLRIFTFVGLAGRSVFFAFFNRLAVRLFVLFLRVYLLVVTSLLRKLYELLIQGVVFNFGVLGLQQGLK